MSPYGDCEVVQSKVRSSSANSNVFMYACTYVRTNVCLYVGERQRDREPERQRDRETERQGDRQTEREDRETERQRDTETECRRGEVSQVFVFLCVPVVSKSRGVVNSNGFVCVFAWSKGRMGRSRK